jgi:hypothetical protein
MSVEYMKFDLTFAWKSAYGRFFFAAGVIAVASYKFSFLFVNTDENKIQEV